MLAKWSFIESFLSLSGVQFLSLEHEWIKTDVEPCRILKTCETEIIKTVNKSFKRVKIKF
jgi:hypothetical protein